MTTTANIEIKLNAELAARIQAACDSTEPFTKDRMKALKAVKWTLKVAGISNDVYALPYTSIDQKEYLTDLKEKAVVLNVNID